MKKEINAFEERESAGRELAKKLWKVIYDLDVSERTVYYALQSMLREIAVDEDIYLTNFKANEVIQRLQNNEREGSQ